jgi:hypothetical protein
MPIDTLTETKGTARIAGQREEYLINTLHDYISFPAFGREAAFCPTQANNSSAPLNWISGS